MGNKPGNIVLLALAIFLLLDILVVRPTEEGAFLISVGVLGALLSRAFLKDPQPVIVCLLGLALTLYSVLRNGGAVDRNSDDWYVLCFPIAVTYALWEKIYRWFSM
jgi:hypothetical protein